MGCGSSKEREGNEGTGSDFDPLNGAGVASSTFLPTSGPLTAKDYKSRLVTSEGTQTLTLPQSSITLRYAFVSQRGYYPDTPSKANQDSLCIHTHFGGDPEQVFFGVFDGHGEYGTQCSQFAKDKARPCPSFHAADSSRSSATATCHTIPSSRSSDMISPTVLPTPSLASPPGAQQPAGQPTLPAGP
ncbi:predicted protein [Haematococcus lacustris]|uniref:Uncharacterized protein n=1 Tax=Haematococcus lacustris TaxID=44745 RepID=A0A699ZCJ8_HAELA|nr:predicted protein [Haematococcus lacustris]